MIKISSEFIDDISNRVSQWERDADPFIRRNNEIADMWRMRPPARRGGDTQLTNTRTAELVRASEAIGTLMYRMWTASDPNFDVVPRQIGADGNRLIAISNIIQWQQMHLQYRKKLEEAATSLAVFGTVIVEEPWKMTPNAKNPVVEGTDFVPRSLSQVAFNTAVPDISESDWFATIDFVTANEMRAKAKRSPKLWDAAEIEDAIDASKDKNRMPEHIKDRRRSAGYQEDNVSIMQLVTFRGFFDDLPAENDNHWVISVLNDHWQVGGHPNPFDHGEMPFRVAKYMSFEMEPYGYGIGTTGFLTHKQLDATRNMTMDTIIMSLFNMWIVSTLADVKGDTMKMVPLGIVRAADTDGIKPLRPDLNAARAGIDLDALLKDEFRSATGATHNLQGIVTEATATESAIVQNEALRRIGVYAEISAEELIRKHLHISHRNNIQFLDKDLWLTVSGEEKPQRVNKDIINMDADFLIKVTTDKDYRPQRMQSLIQYLQILSSVRQDIPNAQEEVQNAVREIKRMLGMKLTSARGRDGDIIKRVMDEALAKQRQQTSVGTLQQSQGRAQTAAQNLPPDSFISPNGEPGIPPEVPPVLLP